MALLHEIKNAWPLTATQSQVGVLNSFSNLLLNAAKYAAVQLGIGKFEDAGKHGLKAEERFFADNPKPHRFFRASAGYTIEKGCYKALVDACQAKEIEPGTFQGTYFDFVFAFERTTALAGILPCSFKSSRPDIRLALGNDSAGSPLEAIFDLTSEAQKDHVLKKGDNWVAKAAVPYIAEVLWTNDDIMLKTY
jgi:hypothetical protein